MNKKLFPYLSGLVFNLAGFFLGSNILIKFVAQLYAPQTEYEAYLLWCFTGLFFSFLGNVLGILVIAPINKLRTLLGAFTGLVVGIGLSFVPLLYFGGIITIFM